MKRLAAHGKAIQRGYGLHQQINIAIAKLSIKHDRACAE
jgi:hypothetical protein